MNETFLNGFADRWLQAWNSHDTGEVLALLHDEIVWDDRTFWPEVIHGIAGMPAYVDKIWEAMPDVAFTETERFFNPGHTRGVVLFEQAGSAPEKLGVTGSYRSHGCDIFLEFRDGLLAHYLGAYDIVRMLEQMGALPPRGTRTGSAQIMALARGAPARVNAVTLDFGGDVVIVTGAGAGLGRRYALDLGASGARVVVNARDGAAAQAVVGAIGSAGGMAVAAIADARDGAAIAAAALAAFGRIDGLIVNAGVVRDASFPRMTGPAWAEVLDVHLGGAYAGCAAVWPHLSAQGGGSIVLTTSGAGLHGNFGQANYAAAKAGVIGLAKTLAVEGARRGIRVNAVAPMAVTGMTDAVFDDHLSAALPAEAVSPVVLALIHRSCPLTGEVVETGGGWASVLRWERSAGVRFAPGELDAAAVAARWSDITRFGADADHPTTTAHSLAAAAPEEPRMPEYLITSVEKGVGILQLDHPEKRNALGWELHHGIIEVLERWAYDDEVAAVLLIGDEEQFCAGWALDVLQGATPEDLTRFTDLAHRLMVTLYDFRKPTVAAVAGVAPGYGMDLANMCDVTIASENAAFGSTQVKYAMNGFYHGLLRKTNSQRARRMFFTGDPIDAQEALRVGIADEVVPVGTLRESALRLAGQIAEHGAELTVILKEVALRASHMDHVAATAYELRVTHDLLGRGLSTRRIADGLGQLRAGRGRATQRLVARPSASDDA